MKTVSRGIGAATLLLALAACSNRVAGYNALVRTVAGTILVNAALCEHIASEYRQAWSDAIDSRHKDFNDELAKKRTELAASLLELKRGEHWIDSAMRTLNDDVPEGSQDWQRKLLKFYGKYSRWRAC